MFKAIFICFVFMAVNTNDWEIEAQRLPHLPNMVCYSRFEGIYTVCGSDGKDYPCMQLLECAQETDHGTRVNLQLVRRWPCFIWDKLGIDTSTFFFVSKIQIDSILGE